MKVQATIAAPVRVQETPNSLGPDDIAQDWSRSAKPSDAGLWAGFRRLLSEVEILYVSGLALLCFLIAILLLENVANLRAGEEAFEWGVFLIMGTIFPALVFTLALASRLAQGRSAELLTGVKVLLIAFLCLAAIYLAGVHGRQNGYVYGIIAVLSLTQFVLCRKHLREATGRVSPGFMAINLCVILLSWLCTVPYLWWQNFESRILVDRYGALVVGPALLLVVSTIFSVPSAGSFARHSVWLVVGACGDAVALVIIALASSRSDLLFDGLAFHHWGVFVGPAEMVRQGEWLLWDVPSQYGFLSILTLARFPGLSALNPWQALYILNAAALFLTACLAFSVMRALRPGIIGRCFALVVTLAAVFWLPGEAWHVSGPHYNLSVGGFRFFWCPVLLAILLWYARSASTRRKQTAIVLAGSVAWVVGILWSFESAVYCTAIWLPAYLILTWSRALDLRTGHGSWRISIRNIVPMLLLPPTLLACVVGIIEAYYRFRLGQGPDWLAYTEYSLSFSSGGFGALPINAHGPVWTLFLVFCVLATTIVLLMRAGNQGNGGMLALVVGAWGGFWATSSYYVGRSHDNNATNLAAFLYLAIGVLLFALTRTPGQGAWKMLIRTSLAPPLIMLLIATVGGSAFWVEYLPAVQVGYPNHIERQLPAMSASQLDLLRTAHVKPDDPFVMIDDPLVKLGFAVGNLPHAWTTGDTEGSFVPITPAWLPMSPWAAMVPLSAERQMTYMARYITRTQLSGWLMQSKSNPYTNLADFPWFADQLSQTHRPTALYENDQWQLIWFEFRPSSASLEDSVAGGAGTSSFAGTAH